MANAFGFSEGQLHTTEATDWLSDAAADASGEGAKLARNAAAKWVASLSEMALSDADEFGRQAEAEASRVASHHDGDHGNAQQEFLREAARLRTQSSNGWSNHDTYVAVATFDNDPFLYSLVSKSPNRTDPEWLKAMWWSFDEEGALGVNAESVNWAEIAQSYTDEMATTASRRTADGSDTTPMADRLMGIDNEVRDENGTRGYGGPSDPARIRDLKMMAERIVPLLDEITQADLDVLEYHNYHTMYAAVEYAREGQLPPYMARRHTAYTIGPRADLRGADLAGADLAGAYLPDADLSGAYLIDADLRHADLSGANLTNADLTGADLTDADLRGTNFDGANLDGAIGIKRTSRLRTASDLPEIGPGADLRGANLSGVDLLRADLAGADLTKADLRGANLREANFENAKLEFTDFRDADLRDANLRGAYLRYAHFSDANLEYADLTGADLFSVSFGKDTKLFAVNLTGADLRYASFDRNERVGAANLTGADLRGAHMRGCDLRGSDLTDANLEGAELDGVGFDKVKAPGANFRAASLASASFYRASVVGANFSYAYLQGVYGESANFSNANLSEAQLSSSRFEHALFSGANLTGATLGNVILYHADLRNANLSGAYLKGSDFTRAKLDGANLDGANLDAAIGLPRISRRRTATVVSDDWATLSVTDSAPSHLIEDAYREYRDYRTGDLEYVRGGLSEQLHPLGGGAPLEGDERTDATVLLRAIDRLLWERESELEHRSASRRHTSSKRPRIEPGADLSGANLRESDLSRSDLSDADLRGADLRDADLTNADLRDADLRDADLTSAYLPGADLTRAKFPGAKALYADFTGTNLNGADFREANLSGAGFSTADLSGANLTGADLSGADFTDADLSGATLTGATLSSATLTGADLTYANLSGADLTYADLNDVNLTGANLDGANLDGAIGIKRTSRHRTAGRRTAVMFASPEEHAANPPETWRVVKVTDRLWELRPAGSDYAFFGYPTKREAEEAKRSGFYFDLYNDEARWYAGEPVPHWKPYEAHRRTTSSAFPGAGAQVYYNEAGEPMGWDYPSSYEEEPYSDYDDGRWAPEFDGEGEYCNSCEQPSEDLEEANPGSMSTDMYCPPCMKFFRSSSRRRIASATQRDAERTAYEAGRNRALSLNPGRPRRDSAGFATAAEREAYVAGWFDARIDELAARKGR